jgi:hypothetical protein
MKFEKDNLGKGQVDFLIKEMEGMARERQEVSDLQEKRLSSFSVIIGFSITFVGYLLKSNKLEEESNFPILLPLFIAFVGLTVFITGVITFIRVLYRQLQVNALKSTLSTYKNELMKIFLINNEVHLLNLINHEISDDGILKWSFLSIGSIVSLLNSLFITVYFSTFSRFVFLEDICCRKMLIPLSIAIYIISIFMHLIIKYIIEKKYNSKKNIK